MVRAKLESLLQAQSRPFDDGELLAGIRELAEACGGEMLFDLPTDRGDEDMSHWTVLRFAHDGDEDIVHVFLSGRTGDYRIADNDHVPARYSSFTRTWVDVLTKWAAETHAPRQAEVTLQ